MTCGRGSRHGSVYESTIKPIIDKRCMQCHDGCNPNIPNPTAIIRDLARLLPDAHIASVLNRAGKRTGRDNTWTEPRVRAFRHDHHIPVYRPGERAERSELTLIEAARARGISKATVQRLIAKGVLEARQVCKGAPWVIKTDALAKVQLSWRCPVPHDPSQNALEF